MALPHVQFTRALEAAVLVKGLMELSRELPGKHVSVTVRTAVGDIAFNFDSNRSAEDNAKSEAEFSSAIDAFPGITASTGELRGQHGPLVEYSDEDQLVGRFGVTGYGTAAVAIKLLAGVRRIFNTTGYRDVVGKSVGESESAALTLRERSVADLQAAISKLAALQADLVVQESARRSRLEDEQARSYQARVDKLDAEFRDRHQALEADKAKQEATLAERVRGIDAKEKDFDTREARYVRRALLVEMKSVLKEFESMSLSQPTGEKRGIIHKIVAVLLFVCAAVAGVLLWRICLSESPDVRLLAPFTGAFLAFILTGVYYLKWNDRWFREHADAELAAKRYKADIVRASWVAELSQEWLKEGRGELPAELVSAYTRSLFMDIGPSRVDDHPTDVIAKLLLEAKRFSIKKSGLSVWSGGRTAGRAQVRDAPSQLPK